MSRFIYLLILLPVFFGYINSPALGQKKDRIETGQPYPKDAKIDEHPDGNGNVVRTIKYKKAGGIVTETQVIPAEHFYNVAINTDTMNKDSVLVIVSKGKNKLEVYYRRNPIRTYKAVFGPKPSENKSIEGDRCTPEGWFHIVSKNGTSHYHKFLLLDYPNDSTNARLNRMKSKGIVSATAMPGHDIGIHGVWHGGDELIDRKVGWTDGCVALKNHDVDDLWRFVSVGTRVYIRK